MLTLNLEEFMVELKEGSLKHVGPTNKAATVKLYDIDGLEVREFGDERVKLTFADDEGNEVEIALFPEQASEVARGIEALEDGSEVYD
ncbi:hypothetical protein [Halorientalis marina]|jgi:hypothetical protein|uniref:hypothetical protein n=1 Tax=Halorientalis marina TaxID=2931976 RepID=UPI001FF5D44F|nr:hypothetical protein [Halorientalis marina]